MATSNPAIPPMTPTIVPSARFWTVLDRLRVFGSHFGLFEALSLLSSLDNI